MISSSRRSGESPDAASALITTCTSPGLRNCAGDRLTATLTWLGHVAAVAQACEGSSLRVGAQTMHWEEKGAYTGEVSAAMLAGIAEYVIIGHSERRQYFCETDETVNKKLRSAVAAGLKPIVCVGETGDQRQAGQTAEVLRRQVRGAFEGQPEVPAATTVVAYEPVWAIGTGRTATPAEARASAGRLEATR